MKVLAIIDAQNDFINGSLGVGRNKWSLAKAEIMKLIELESYDKFIFTKDWHPANHCSFKEQGGKWPAHCVQHTKGSELDSGLDVDISKSFFITKGENPNKEEYGIDLIKDSTEPVEEVHIVGLCYDYCVANCAKLTSEAHPDTKVIVKKLGTVAIDPTATPDFGNAIVE